MAVLVRHPERQRHRRNAEPQVKTETSLCWVNYITREYLTFWTNLTSLSGPSGSLEVYTCAGYQGGGLLWFLSRLRTEKSQLGYVNTPLVISMCIAWYSVSVTVAIWKRQHFTDVGGGGCGGTESTLSQPEEVRGLDFPWNPQLAHVKLVSFIIFWSWWLLGFQNKPALCLRC